jgi:hypothetical protein
LQVINLTGGVTAQSQSKFRLGNAMAIIADFNQFDAALLYLYINAFGTCIKAVFHQFFKH